MPLRACVLALLVGILLQLPTSSLPASLGEPPGHAVGSGVMPRPEPSEAAGFLWERQFGGVHDDHASDVAADEQAVYVVGFVTGNVAQGIHQGGQYDGYIQRRDHDGAEAWSRLIGTAAQDSARGVAVDSTGVYVVGATSGALFGQVNAGGGDAYIRKYATDGRELWTRQFGGLSDDSSSDVAVHGSGVYVVGTAADGFGDTSAFLRRYDGSGNLVWARTFGTASDERGEAVAVSTSGAYVVGMTEGALGGPALGFWDGFLRKYDLNGNVVWTRQFGSPTVDSSFDVAVFGDRIFVAGATLGALPSETNAGETDVILLAYDSNGVLVGSDQFGTAESDAPTGIAANATGVYLAGWSTGAFGGPTNAGLTDAFLGKFNSAAGTFDWTTQFGTTGSDYAAGVALADGGIYLAGSTSGQLTPQREMSAFDMFLRRYDGSGSPTWTRQFGSLASDVARAAASDSSGLYVGGGTDGFFAGQVSRGGFDAFLRKMGPDGATLWTRQFGTSSGDFVTGLAVGGDVYAAGVTAGDLFVANAGENDAFVVRYGTGGDRIWERQFGTERSEEAWAVSAHTTGVYVVGDTTGDLGGTNEAYRDVFLRKYDPAGNVLWTRQFGFGGTDDIGQAVAADDSGAYVAGQIARVAPGLPDAFLRKYDHAGNVLWTRTIGGAGSEGASALAVDVSGVYVGGTARETLSAPAEPFVQKYDLEGRLVWESTFGTSGEDIATALAVDSSGIYLVGGTDGVFPDATAWGEFDGFLAKLHPNGSVAWSYQFGTAGLDSPASVLVGEAGMYVVGSTTGAFAIPESPGVFDIYATRFATAPWEPRNLGAVAEPGRVFLAWQDPAFDGGAPTTGYLVYRGTASGSLELVAQIGDVLAHADETVTNGVTYYYAVSAVNEIGEGPMSAEVSAVPRGPPSAPRSLGATSGDGEVNLAWVAPSSDGGSPVLDYRVYRGLAPDSLSLLGNVGTELSYRDTGLTNEVTYYYAVSAVNEIGEGALSDVASARPEPEPDVTRPIVVVTSPANGAVLDSTSVTVSGTASDDTHLLKVEVSTDGVQWILAQGTTSWSATLALAEGPNTIYARATDASGNSETTAIAVTVEIPIEIEDFPLYVLWIPAIVMAVLVGVAVALRIRSRKGEAGRP